MKRLFSVFFLGILLALAISSCTQRLICPAYQSAFIYDEEELSKKFSYFEDSIPKEQFIASKDQFLIIDYIPYHKKLRKLQTIEMVDVYPKEDSTTTGEFAGYGYDSTAVIAVEVDSSALDTTKMQAPWEEKFNIEQENYLYYFNDILVYPDERAAMEAADAKMREIQGQKKGFFKRLFGKKDKTPQGSLVGEDSTATEKKGFFKRLFGKKKKTQMMDEPMEGQGDGDLEEQSDYYDTSDPDLARPGLPEGLRDDGTEPTKKKKKKVRKPKKKKKKKAKKPKEDNSGQETDVPLDTADDEGDDDF